MSGRYPPGRRYALPGADQSCATCEHWQIDPDTLSQGRCCYSDSRSPKRFPFTMECHVCDVFASRLSSLVEMQLSGALDGAR
jgi:hypothetical protein